MTTLSKNATVSIVVLLMLVGVGAAATKLFFREARSASDYSAHVALTSEICNRLAAVPQGQHYPASLSQLQLTFPDGGNTSFLGRFTYTSDGTSCTLRTVVRSKEVVRSYP